MKNLIYTILIAFTLATAPGCGTTPQKATYAAVVSSRVTVNSAWDGFRQQRLLGKVSDDQWREGVKAMQAYKAARHAAIQIAKASNGDEPSLDKALLSVSIAYDPLFKILVQYFPELANTK